MSLKQILPELHDQLHKGQCGRIGIVGGCKEYSGAPFFAGSMAFRLGADLVYVFTADDASSAAVKAHSPDLIVMPFDAAMFDKTVQKLHAVVVGPGGGTSDDMSRFMKHAVLKCIDLKRPLVMDADSLALLNQVSVRDALKKSESTVMLTPNVNECKKLLDAYQASDAKKLDLGPNVFIYEKGNKDVVTNQSYQTSFDFQGAPRRVGGQGDLTAGSLGVMLAWVDLHQANTFHNSDKFKERVKSYNLQAKIENGAPFMAAEAASQIVRTSIKEGYAQFGRSLLTSDVLHLVPKVLMKL